MNKTTQKHKTLKLFKTTDKENLLKSWVLGVGQGLQYLKQK